MYVKNEPSFEYDNMSFNVFSNMESDVIREEIFGTPMNSCMNTHDNLLDGHPEASLDESFSLPTSDDIKVPFISSHEDGSLQTFTDFIGDCDSLLSPCDLGSVEEKVKKESKCDFSSVFVKDDSQLWEMLFEDDVKPTVNNLATPPDTPPHSAGSSPVSCQLSASQPSGSVLRCKIIRENGKILNTSPVKIVAVTANGFKDEKNGFRLGRVTKNTKVQPKVIKFNTKEGTITESTEPPKFIQPAKSIIDVQKDPLILTAPMIGGCIIGANPPSQVQKVFSNCVSSTQTAKTLPPIAPAIQPKIQQDAATDLQALKRYQRMIKNRESASMSRKKKREYVMSLESQVRELSVENARLKEENLSLHHKLSLLESDKNKLPHKQNSIGKKSTTIFVAVVFLMSLNLAPLTSLLLNTSMSSKSSLQPTSSGGKYAIQQRSLLWLEKEEGIEENVPNASSTAFSTCPLYINDTERLRLESDLRGWFQSSPETPRKMFKKDLPRRKDKIRRKSHKVPPYSSEVNALIDSSYLDHSSVPYIYHRALQFPRHEVGSISDVFPSASQLTSFMDSFNRRNDTYYVVSFSADHLLVPANQHNTTARPRMSLLLPTLKSPYNESLPNTLSFMQIDCEVTHTNSVHISKAKDTSARPPTTPVKDTRPKSQQHKLFSHSRPDKILALPYGKKKLAKRLEKGAPYGFK